MPRGGFGGRGFGGRGFGMRRYGAPLVYPGMGMGGMGMGSPLLTSLLAGGVGYALGSSSAQQAPPQAATGASIPTISLSASTSTTATAGVCRRH